jgi:hypothetical protein
MQLSPGQEVLPERFDHPLPPCYKRKLFARPIAAFRVYPLGTMPGVRSLAEALRSTSVPSYGCGLYATHHIAGFGESATWGPAGGQFQPAPNLVSHQTDALIQINQGEMVCWIGTQ